MEGWVGDSFPTISSTGANAAVIHYHAEHANCKPIDVNSGYLCDTGGQYVDGTTDVTRTLRFGSQMASADEKRAYTRVLQGHIALAQAVFPAGTPGIMLEMLARSPLWKVRLAAISIPSPYDLPVACPSPYDLPHDLARALPW